MDGLLPQLGLVVVLVVINALFAGSELALISLREGQLQRLESRGGAGAVLARLAREPNRFLATIQIGITLAGFLASASAAVSLAQPLEEPLAFLGDFARPTSIVFVTLILSYVTLVFGELAPKRIAMQRAETWGLLAARPLAFLAKIGRPAVWLLSQSADVAVRLMGGDPSRHREDVTQEELRDLVTTQTSFSNHQREIISGAFDISQRILRQVLRPRRDVVALDQDMDCSAAVALLVEAGHSRAPVGENGDLDKVTGVVHIRDLVFRSGPVSDRALPPLLFPESKSVLEAMREMRQSHQHMAVVIGEHGTAEGIVTLEDFIEELVGEIYDESDRDVLMVDRRADGAVELPGRFPIHDLPDLGIEVPEGDYTTVAGLVLDQLGRLPEGPGDMVTVGVWEATVLAVEARAITRVSLRRTVAPPNG